MKIMYVDKVQEIKPLLETAATTKASHVAITVADMQAILKHMKADTIFPDYMSKRAGEIKRVTALRNDVKKKLNGNSLNETERNQLFDREHTLSARLLELEKETPSELVAFNGIKVKTALGV